MATSTDTPTANEYSPTENFLRDRKTRLKGIFNGTVIAACFNGHAEYIENYKYQSDFQPLHGAPGEYPEELIMMVGEIEQSYFGLLLDPLNKRVITGHVLQVNAVEAARATEPGTHSLRLWEPDAIDRMQRLAAQHEGKVRNAYIDPRLGESEKWVDDREHDHPKERFNITGKAARNL